MIAYGVNVGGVGFALGSLANLIALRMASGEKVWLQFHLYSVPVFIVTAGMGSWLVVLPWLR